MTYVSGLLSYNSRAEVGSPEYAAYTDFVQIRTDAHLSLIADELHRAGHDGKVEIDGEEALIIEAAKVYRSSQYGQSLSRGSRWRHHQGNLTPEEHHLLLGSDAKIFDHALGTMHLTAQLAADRLRLAQPAPHDFMLGVRMLAELTHESSEDKLEDILSFGKDPATSLLEQMLNVHAGTQVFRDSDLFLHMAPLTDKRDLGAITDDDLREAEARFESITDRPSHMLARDIRDIIAHRTPEQTQAATEHALIEKLVTFPTAMQAWSAVQSARQYGSSRGVYGEKFERDYTSLTLNVMIRNIATFATHAAHSGRFKDIVRWNRTAIDDIFQEDPSVFRRILQASDEVLGDRTAVEHDVDTHINAFQSIRESWNNFSTQHL